MAGRVRVGVVGAGFGAQVHIPAFQSEGVDVVAVCDRRKDRAEAVARRFGIPHAFEDYRALLRLSDLDAVSIVTPTPLHYDMSLAAIDAGKHLLCEKPLTVDAGQAEDVWRRSSQSGLTAMVCYEFRFAPAVAGAKALLQGGYVGRPRMCFLRLMVEGPRVDVGEASRSGQVEGGGLLLGIGSHYVDCLRYWFGEVESVSGELRALRYDGQRSDGATPPADDTFLFTLTFDSGAIANMAATVAAPLGTGASIEIYGDEGALISPAQAVSWRALSSRGKNPPAGGRVLAGRIGDAALTELPVPLEGGAEAERDVHLLPFRRLVREFVRGIAEGQSPSPNFYDGYRCQQILEAVSSSARDGVNVKIRAAPAFAA